ncbi:MAG TPA: protein translocase subunit SecD [Candidatus Eisenbacteria bacterium]|nr:protein translocase subunit SecD [Candidatus Eisenbacteria bacterium]
MKKPRLFFAFLLVLTALAVFIIVPAFSFKTFRLPLLNKSLSISYPAGIHIKVGSFAINKDFPFQRGLDLQGGTSVTLKADMKKIKTTDRDSALETAKSVIERRINLFGVKEPVIQTAKVNGDYRIIVELPGVNVEQAVQLVGTTAQLTFWEPVASTSALVVDPNTLPIGIIQTLGPFAHQTDLTGSDLQNAAVVFDSKSGAPQVQLTFTPSGAKKFADITTRNVGKRVAMVLDNVVLEAPTVNEPILTGDGVISGGFTTDVANQLSIQLRAGSLPVPLSVLQQQSIGATLGVGSLEKSLFAGSIGFLVIVVFMVFLYGRLGVIASFALIVYTLLALAVFKLIPVTLTLAGIAGFILSIGMAVDANILIFERMKEEMREGKSRKVAIELGFSRAWTSIRDSNIATLITSFVLYQFGTGIVRGFAFTLALGVLISMFSAISVTRTFLRMFYYHE